ncbi:MAG: cation:proton antiporter [Candidatus Melainabacteria bacterium]|nr:cation:proton antiporter [Candidatus Melainabacteria bacterium]
MDIYTALLVGSLIFLSSFLSIKFMISAALIEIAMGAIAGNFLGLHQTEWIKYLGEFGGIVLTYLAGTEVDIPLLKAKLKESLLIGGISFLAPFISTFLFAYYVVHWSFQASEISGIALSTTSLAVIYAVLVETGLVKSDLGKLLMAACFITDLGTAIALSIMFAHFNFFTVIFTIVSVLAIIFTPKIISWMTKSFGFKVVEPELKFLFFVLFSLMWLAKLGNSHAVLPTFILGLAMSDYFKTKNKELQTRFRAVAFTMLNPFFFIKGGLNISFGALQKSLYLLVSFFFVKVIAKIAGVLPFAKKYVPKEAIYTTLLMSTGLTFGTISSLYGLNAGIIDTTQFSILVTVVILSAVIPTLIAQKFFEPKHIYKSIRENEKIKEAIYDAGEEDV